MRPLIAPRKSISVLEPKGVCSDAEAPVDAVKRMAGDIVTILIELETLNTLQSLGPTRKRGQDGGASARRGSAAIWSTARTSGRRCCSTSHTQHSRPRRRIRPLIGTSTRTTTRLIISACRIAASFGRSFNQRLRSCCRTSGSDASSAVGPLEPRRLSPSRVPFE